MELFFWEKWRKNKPSKTAFIIFLFLVQITQKNIVKKFVQFVKI